MLWHTELTMVMKVIHTLILQDHGEKDDSHISTTRSW